MVQQNSHSTSETRDLEPNKSAPEVHSVNPYSSGILKWCYNKAQGKLRVNAAWLFFILSLILTRDYPSSYFLIFGVLISFMGACLRYWASGYLRKDNKLTVSGPYQLTRNPLYFGTFLMGVGSCLLTQSLALTSFCIFVFGGIYHFVILGEEQKLRKLFGKDYETYTSLVPRFFPDPTRLFGKINPELAKLNPHPETFKFSHALANKNKAYEAFVSFAGLIGFFFLIAWLKLQNY
jgi:protein-S-isoprenylcysteine O-methyltransferase Ste14